MKDEDNTHNGWANYATWRINLEIFDGMDADSFENMNADAVQAYAEEKVFMDVPDGLAKDYARAFMSDVDWREILEHYNGEEEA
tara:strand:+ start:2133 stop:2384 length:252 start_codon:yes stop_codon:yes gene_type:complete